MTRNKLPEYLAVFVVSASTALAFLACVVSAAVFGWGAIQTSHPLFFLLLFGALIACWIVARDDG